MVNSFAEDKLEPQEGIVDVDLKTISGAVANASACWAWV